VYVRVPFLANGTMFQFKASVGYQKLLQGNPVGIRVQPGIHAAVDGSLNRVSKTSVVQTGEYRE
jgi:hypothetical protein